MLVDRRMLYLDLYILWTGLSVSFWSSLLIPAITIQLTHTLHDESLSPADMTSKGLMAMTMFGFGEVFGSQFMGKVIDKVGAKKATFLNLFNIIVMVAITTINLRVLRYNVLSFIMCFVWGWQDGSLNIHIC